MDTRMPRIESVQATGAGRQLTVTWKAGTDLRGEPVTTIDIDGWVASGGEVLTPLTRPEVFQAADVGEHGASVTWDGGEGDLSIDAVHLQQIGREQQSFTAEDVVAWQAELRISNREAANLLGVSTSTWATYKAGTAPIPHAIRLLCRSTLRDPLTLHAWLRPAPPPGRPARRIAGG